MKRAHFLAAYSFAFSTLFSYLGVGIGAGYLLWKKLNWGIGSFLMMTLVGMVAAVVRITRFYYTQLDAIEAEKKDGPTQKG